MKDLTHYFVSPPKLRGENINDDGIIGSDNQLTSETTKTTTTGVEETITAMNNNEKKEAENVIENENSKEVVVNNKDVKNTPSEKRTRVKIRISLRKETKNRRCDIIENRDDVVDKTPSPFNKVNTLQNENNGTEEEENSRDQTPHNAFKVLMNRNKTTNTPRSSIANTDPEIRKEYKKKLTQNKEKLLTLADKKGNYSKRKLAEIEEAEAIENRLRKRAKLFRKDDQDRAEDKIKKKKKDTQQSLSKAKTQNNGTKNKQDNNVKKKKKHKSKLKNNCDAEESSKVSTSQGENLAPSSEKEPLTPSRTKAKWTMKVKLQSQSDGDEGQDDDDDYIFTPKSKGRFKKTKTYGSSSDGEDKETKKVDKKSNTKIQDQLKPKNDNVTIVEQESKDLSAGRRTAKVKNRNDEIPNGGEEDTDSIIILDNDMTEINEASKLLQEKKLAPLFVKRSKPNPETLEARRSFLQSGIPENVKKIMTFEQKSYFNDAGISAIPFPMISHVFQSELSLENIEFDVEKGYETSYKLKTNQKVSNLSVDLSQFKSLSKMQERVQGKTDDMKFVHIEREHFETVLKDIESRCSDTRSMWESVSLTALNPTLKKSPKRRSKKLKLQKTVDDIPDSPNPTWTYKYKPINSMEVVGNEGAIVKLRNWLTGWRLSSNKEDKSSGDEFYSSDCSNNSYYENNQVAVLVGPYGSGKSASVYAIAEELGYRVLEVNASSRRTGKKILSDFQEATKSHRVKRDQGTLLPIKKKQSDKKVPQNSLILIEDVDLIFEEDEGFVSATFQLAANTRRPIVMTCKESCSHLYRMAPQLQFINFNTASGKRVSALLELIALAESGYRLSKSYLDILLRNGDLRQSLLQLQYILLSGPPSVSQLGTRACSTLWEDMQQLIYKPAIKCSRKWKKESSNSKLPVEQNKELINMLAKKLDNISLVSLLTEIENPATPPWKKKLSPSLSLFEDFKPYSNSDDLSCEISDWLRSVSLKSDRETQNNSDIKESGFAIKRKVKLGIDLALSQAIPSTLEHRSKAVDYLPIIRTMCRSEENRASINPKRGNRFHNYLHGLNLASASNNILAAASSVFQEKSA